MTQTSGIIILAIMIVAIIAVVILLRRKPGSNAPVANEVDVLLPEQVTPEARMEPAPPPPAAPQTIAAEETAPAVVEATPEPVFPAPPTTPTITPVSSGGEDNLLKLKGVGPKIATLLRAEGITRFSQIAAWTDADIAAIDAKLGSFAGRPRRDDWIDQSRFLAAGDTAGYEAKYGKL